MGDPDVKANPEVDLKVVGQIISAIGILHVFPSEIEIANFLVPLLKGVPGCESASLCFRKLAHPLGDVQGHQCLACAQGLDQRVESGPYPCGLVEAGKPRAYPLQTVDGFYGYLVLKVAGEGVSGNYDPFIRSLGNALAILLENRHQKAELQAAKVALENRVEERTRELANVIESCGDMIAMLDMDYCYRLFNCAFHDEFQRVFGQDIKPDDSLLQVLEHVPGDLATAKEYWDRVLGGEDFTVTREFGDSALQRIWYEIHFSPVRDAEGKVVSAVQVARNITGRKQAEEALRKNEERWRFALHAGQMGAWDLDLVTHSAYRSPRHDQIFGYETMLPTWTYEMFLEHVLPEDRSEVDRAFREANAAHGIWTFECRIRRADNAVRWIFAEGAQERNKEGIPVRMSGVVQDITERKLMEEALRKSEHKFHVVADFTYDWEYWVGEDGRMIYVSPSCERTTGYTCEEFYSDNLLLKKIVHPEDVQLFDAHLRETHDEDRAELQARTASTPSNLPSGNRVEYRIIKKDGSVVHIGHLCQPVFDEGRYRGRRVSSRDITERKVAEARIARLTQLYAALSQSNQAIVHSDSEEDLLPTICRDLVKFGGMKMAWIGLLDEATGIVRPVAAYGIGTEYTEGIQISVKPEDPLGKGPTGSAIRENRAFWCEDFQNDPSTVPWHERGAQYGWAATASLPIHREGRSVGALSIYSDKTGIFDDDARGLLDEIASDVSFALDSFTNKAERKRAMEALEEKTAEMERFAYTVSHDLKSPLVTIMTFLRYLERDLDAKKPDSVTKDLGFIHGAADKMGGRLDALLKLARTGLNGSAPAEVTVQEIAKEAIGLVAGQIAERGVQLQVTKEPVWITGDHARLVEVFQNLIDNAVKFLGDQPQPRIEIGAEKVGGDIVLFVRDNGKGIDLQHQTKVFGLFEKLDASAPGSGMGLALVRRIVELHGGKIWVESEGLGHGTTFRFTFAKSQLRQPA